MTYALGMDGGVSRAMKAHILRVLAWGCLSTASISSAQYATLITTFTNPTPAINDRFGYPVAALGPDKIVIGAYFDSTREQGAYQLF